MKEDLLGPGLVLISPDSNTFQIKGIAAKIKTFNKQGISNIELVNIETIITYLCQNR